jgi:hypothetical protein
MEKIRFLFGRYAAFPSRCGEMDGRSPLWVMGLGGQLHGSNLEPLMSALGQKQTSTHVRIMSALPPKADIG